MRHRKGKEYIVTVVFIGDDVTREEVEQDFEELVQEIDYMGYPEVTVEVVE
jgi:hypothetical protein